MQFKVFDTETGGFSPTQDALASIAVVTLDEQLNEISRYYTLIIEPDKNLGQDALNVNGLTIEQILKEGKPIENVLNELHELLDGSDNILVAHNISFDASFLNARKFNITHGVDTMLLSRQVFRGQPAKLSSVAMRFGIEVKDAHNSLGDVLMTCDILRKFSKSTWLNALEPKPIVFKS